ncbi:MAG: hypothetical protein Q7K38_03260 [Candidatus Wildermuthbacteria bacterium]|nr:hypothetical protein [Candidatus Wildermuthbacteria bacterium]
MESNGAQLVFLLEILLLATVVFMHLTKKNSSVVSAYMAQSIVVTALLLISSSGEWKPSFLLLVAIIFLVKVLIAPRFFYTLIKKHELKFSGSTYLSTSLSLIVLAVLTALTYSPLLQPFAALFGKNQNALLIAITMMLISLFLVINRKGALSQMMGILSLENAIVSFALLAGLERSFPLQLGILFDILIWVAIATVFVSMIYRQFGSLDVSAMKDLTEE